MFFIPFILLYQLFPVLCSRLDPLVATGKSDKIVGGYTAAEHEYPFMVYFVAGPKDRLCGGAIITKQHVVTAAHCLRTSKPDKYAYVIVGEHRVVFQQAFGPNPGEIYGESMIPVKRFIRRWDGKDIAILELARDLEFSNRIQPACIAEGEEEDYAGWKAVVTGWGGIVGYQPGWQRGVQQKGSNTLKEVSLEVLKPESRLCIKAKGSSKDTLCTYTSGSDSCQGDSGGPVFVDENGRYVLIGVVSRGKGCAARGHAGVNTRISYFAAWIRDNVGQVCTSASEDKQTTTTTRRTTTTRTTTTTTRTTTRRAATFIKPSGCRCSKYINENGFGNCRKLDTDFGGSKSCYVVHTVSSPSTCGDLVGSSTNPGKFLSAQACQNSYRRYFR